MIRREWNITFDNDEEKMLYDELKVREELPEFANVYYTSLKKMGKVMKMLDFIKKNPECNEEDIIEKWAEFKGIKKLSD